MHHIIIQWATDKLACPSSQLLRKWAKQALKDKADDVEVTLRIVDVMEMTMLNSQYRKKDGPTNVLSFPFTTLPGVELDTSILGDIVICADVVNREAKEASLTPDAHWSHMVVHGILHLLGHDHQQDDEAAIMEALEIKILAKLGFANPYTRGDDIRRYE